MIPEGMKVGDTYEYYGLTYKVTGVCGENYISERISAEPKEEPKVEKKQEAVETVSDYESLPYAQLKKLCAERGLDASGKKSDLIARLEG